MTRYRSRMPRVNPQHPDAWGRCDLSGLPVMHADMVKQYEYLGRTLSWTGWIVNRMEADEPNPSLMPPKLFPDPLPVPNPRYFYQAKSPPVPTELRASVIDSTSIILEWDAVQDAQEYAVSWQQVGLSGVYQDTLEPWIHISETTYTLEGLTPSSTYAVAVASLNHIGAQVLTNGALGDVTFSISAFGGGLSFTPPTLPNLPPEYLDPILVTLPVS